MSWLFCRFETNEIWVELDPRVTFALEVPERGSTYFDTVIFWGIEKFYEEESRTSVWWNSSKKIQIMELQLVNGVFQKRTDFRSEPKFKRKYAPKWLRNVQKIPINGSVPCIFPIWR